MQLKALHMINQAIDSFSLIIPQIIGEAVSGSYIIKGLFQFLRPNSIYFSCEPIVVWYDI